MESSGDISCTIQAGGTRQVSNTGVGLDIFYAIRGILRKVSLSITELERTNNLTKLDISWDEVLEAAKDRTSWSRVGKCIFDTGWSLNQGPGRGQGDDGGGANWNLKMCNAAVSSPSPAYQDLRQLFCRREAPQTTQPTVTKHQRFGHSRMYMQTFIATSHYLNNSAFLLAKSNLLISLQWFDAVGWATEMTSGACKMSGVGLLVVTIWLEFLHVLRLQLSPPLPSSLAPRSLPGKITIKMERVYMSSTLMHPIIK